MPYEFRSIYLDRDIVPGRVFDVFWPENLTQSKALFFVHGGGWRGGARAHYHTIMRAFNARGFICASTDYRLSGSNILDQITDVRQSYDCFSRLLAEHDRPAEIVVYGSSAGAHLAALLTLATPGQCGESLTYGDYALSADAVRPKGVALHATPLTFEPWDDIFPAIWSSMQDIAGVPYKQNPDLYRAVSPMRYVSLSSPPVFLLEAENEHMFLREHSLEFVEKMRAVNRPVCHKIYPRTEHGFFYELTRRQQIAAFEDILSFIESLG